MQDIFICAHSNFSFLMIRELCIGLQDVDFLHSQASLYILRKLLVKFNASQYTTYLKSCGLCEEGHVTDRWPVVSKGMVPVGGWG